MSYLIEVVHGNADFKGYWLRRTEQLRSIDPDIGMELYSFRENIRNADYSHLSILKFHNAERRMKFLHHPDRLLDAESVIDRVECSLDIEIGSISESSTKSVFLVNPFEIEQKDIPDVLDMWHKAKGHMISHKGFVNARLFRSHDPSAKYGLVNIAHWVSSRAFKDALNDRAYDSHRERSMSYKLHPSLCKFEVRWPA